MKLALIGSRIRDLKDGVDGAFAKFSIRCVPVVKAYTLFVGHGRELFELQAFMNLLRIFAFNETIAMNSTA